MGKFTFGNVEKKMIKLEIEDSVVYIPGDVGFAEKLMDIGQEMQRQAAEATADLDGLKALTAYMRDVIEDILGEDGYDEVFREGEPSLEDCYALFGYIIDEVHAFANTVTEAIPTATPVVVPTVPRNREERRVKKRKGR